MRCRNRTLQASEMSDVAPDDRRKDVHMAAIISLSVVAKELPCVNSPSREMLAGYHKMVVLTVSVDHWLSDVY